MHDNTTRRGLGVAIFIVAILGIAAVGAAYLLVSKVGRAGGVANDPAYVAAVSYPGPATGGAGGAWERGRLRGDGRPADAGPRDGRSLDRRVGRGDLRGGFPARGDGARDALRRERRDAPGGGGRGG